MTKEAVLRSFSDVFYARYRMPYIESEKDVASAGWVAEHIRDERLLDVFMPAAFEYMEANSYWKDKVSIVGVEKSFNNINVKMFHERDHEEEQVLPFPVADARSLWSNIRNVDDGYGKCARCRTEGVLVKKVNGYSTAALCSCAKTRRGDMAYYDELEGSAIWHNDDYLWAVDNGYDTTYLCSHLRALRENMGGVYEPRFEIKGHGGIEEVKRNLAKNMEAQVGSNSD